MQAGIALGVDFQNLMVDMGETTEKELTEELEQGISDLSKEYNQAVETNLIMTKILFSFFALVSVVVFLVISNRKCDQTCKFNFKYSRASDKKC